MELQRGVCSLCSENKVFLPPDADHFRACLLEILHEKYINENDFQSIKDLIKLCPLCCFKLQKASDIKKAIKEAEGKELNEKHCQFCHKDNHVMVVYHDWKLFNDRLEGYLPDNFPVYICQQCFFYFDTTFFAKSKLQQKFSQLRKNADKENGTPKRKSMLKSPAISKKRKMYDNCFTYLQPLCNNQDFQVAYKLQKDRRLYKQVAYVDLQHSKDVDLKETPKIRPVIKIKLKKPRGSVDEFVAEPYIKLVKSDEHPSKKTNSKNKGRHSSYTSRENYEIVNEVPEKINETPKTGSLSQLAPKRRVSVYVEDIECGDEKLSDSESDLNKADKIVDVLSTETFINVNSQEDQNAVNKISEPPNGIENGDCAIIESENINNETNVVNENQECASIDLTSASTSPVSSPGASPKNSGSESGSESGDKLRSEDSPTIDSLNGSERKKKRVTFSDEIN